jgi:hypothetical protein
MNLTFTNAGLMTKVTTTGSSSAALPVLNQYLTVFGSA